MTRETKYYFYFGYVYPGIYKSWVDAARDAGLPIRMVTFVSLRLYIRNREDIAEYNSYDHVSIYPAPPSHAVHLFGLLYFLIDLLLGRRVVVHVRKRKQWPLEFLKSIFGANRLRYVIKVEGDPIAERDYLEKNPYKDGFYDEFIVSLEESMEQLPDVLRRADGVLVVSEELERRLKDRYDDVDLDGKTRVIPTGVDFEKFQPSPQVRAEQREALEVDSHFVLVYLGNAFASWQNVSRTVEVFELIKRRVRKRAFLLLLVPERDHEIVSEFVEDVGLSDDEYLLTEVPHSSVPRFLNAADMGVLLRDDRRLNEAASPGKYGEYLAAGLPVLTTTAARYHEDLERERMGVVLEDMDDDEEVVEKVTRFLEDGLPERDRIHEWAEPRFSTGAYVGTYVDFMRSLGEADR